MESISSDNDPYYSEKLAKLKRKKCREYTKRRRSKRWKISEEKHCEELEKAKKSLYVRKIKNLRKMQPKKWHRELKKLTRMDQFKEEKIIVEAIKDLTAKEQAELIANKFADLIPMILMSLTFLKKMFLS